MFKNKTEIKIAYRQIIDSQSSGSFEKNIFNDSFQEFCMQAQVYDRRKKFKTFHELIQYEPRANSLHYKVGFAIGLYVKELNHIIPGLEDSIGQPITFSRY